MTPEELENRLKGLETPEPSPRLRERLLHPAPPAKDRWRALTAVAASFIAVGLIVWIVVRLAPVDVTPVRQETEASRLVEKLGHEDPAERDKATARLIELGEAAEAAVRTAEIHKDPEVASRAKKISGILARGKRFGKITPDRELQEKIERILQANPGKAVLVSRLWDHREKTATPMTSPNLKQVISLQGADDKECDGTGTPLDTEGHIFFLVPPGKLHINGYNMGYPNDFGPFFHIWEGYTGEHVVTEALVLPEQKLVNRMRWTSPAAGDSVSIKKNPDITWEAFPGVTKAEVAMEEISMDMKYERFSPVVRITVDCSKGNRISLAELLKGSRIPLGPGKEVGLTIFGKDDAGKLVGGNTSRWSFILKD